MSLGNTTLWGDILPGGVEGEVSGGGIDTTQVVDELLASLHAGSRADLTWWSEAQLIQWMDEALKRLSRIAMVFIGRQGASPLTRIGIASYTLPLQHVATLHISYSTSALRAGNMLELEARDDAFQSTQGTPNHWYEDLQGGTSFALSPVPDEDDVPLPVIYEGWPTALDAGGEQTLVAGPAPLKGYLAFCVLAEAYGQEGEAEMPDLAAHAKGRMAMYEEMFTGYYGKGM